MVCRCLLASVASLSVLAFSSVTNGSITAFLLDFYRHDPSITWWLLLANTAVVLSIERRFHCGCFRLSGIDGAVVVAEL
jgi:hypothetical protein